MAMSIERIYYYEGPDERDYLALLMASPAVQYEALRAYLSFTDGHGSRTIDAARAVIASYELGFRDGAVAEAGIEDA